MPARHDDDVFSLAEIAAAARVSDAVVLDLAARGCVPTIGTAASPLEALVPREAAVAAVQALAHGGTVGAGTRSVLAVAPEVASRERRAGAGLHRSPPARPGWRSP